MSIFDQSTPATMFVILILYSCLWTDLFTFFSLSCFFFLFFFSINFRLCCLCGTAIPSNPASMCVNCIQTQVDITEGIPKQLTVQWCKGCERFVYDPS